MNELMLAARQFLQAEAAVSRAVSSVTGFVNITDAVERLNAAREKLRRALDKAENEQP